MTTGGKHVLQKLENFYLAILRFVVLLIAGLLLVAVVILAIRSTAALNSAPVPVNEMPQVAQATVKSDVLATGVNTPDQPVTADLKTVQDPNRVYYAQAAASILNFFNSNFPGQYNLDPQKIANLIKEQTDSFGSDDLKAAYAKGIAANTDSVLADPAIVQFAKSHKPSDVAESVIESYAREFNQQVKDTQTKNDAAQAKYLAEQHRAQQSLYAAAAGFGVFLLIVFLSIVIRIERNLRPENRARA